MSVRRTTAGLVLAPVLLVLSACGGGDDSVADPPVSSAPTSSPTASTGHESPEHFIRRWAAEDARIQQTGDTARFRAMSHGCKGCAKLADLVDRIYEAGGYIHTRGWQVRSISKQGRNTYALRVFTSSTTYTKSEGGKPRHLPSGPAEFQLQLQWTTQAWRVTSLVQVAT
jgi:hypothetical protein